MVCSNCQANDSVTIEGKDYCLNCGQLIKSTATVRPQPAAPAPTKSAPPATSASSHPEPPKRPAVLDLTISRHNMPRLRSDRAATMTSPTDPRHQPARHISDIKPTGTGTIAPVTPIPAVTDLPTRLQIHATTNSPTAEKVAHQTHVKHGGAAPSVLQAHRTGLAASWRRQGRRLTLPAALLTSAPFAWFVGMRLRPLVDHNTTLSLTSLKSMLLTGRLSFSLSSDGLFFWAITLGLFWVLTIALIKVLEIGALSYGHSKEADHRPQHVVSWLNAGINSLPRLLVVFAWLGLQMSVLVLLVAIANHNLPSFDFLHGTSHMWARIGVIVVGSIIALYTLAATIGASLAVAIGGQQLRIAWKRGRELAAKLGPLRLVGVMLLDGLVIIVSYALAAATIIALAAGLGRLQTGQYGYWVLIGGGIICLSLAYQSSLSYAIVSALTLYRQAVAYYISDHQGKLLSGRKASDANVAVIMFMFVLAIGLSTGAGYLVTAHRNQLSSWRTSAQSTVERFLR